MPKPLSEKQLLKLIWKAVDEDKDFIELQEKSEFYFIKKKYVAREGDRIYNKKIKIINT